MGKGAKPWLNYKSDAPVRAYPKKPKTKRHFRWALFWLLVGGHIGAHRLYLWDAKKAVFIMVFVFLSFILSLFIMASIFDYNEYSDDTVVGIAYLIPILLIIVFELPRLKRRVDFKNKKHLIL